LRHVTKYLLVHHKLDVVVLLFFGLEFILLWELDYGLLFSSDRRCMAAIRIGPHLHGVDLGQQVLIYLLHPKLFIVIKPIMGSHRNQSIIIGGQVIF
jgi:hypothetical protein